MSCIRFVIHHHDAPHVDSSVHVCDIGSYWVRQKCLRATSAKACENSYRTHSGQNTVLLRSVQKLFSEYQDVQFNEGLPSLNEFDGHGHTLVVIDDLMHETNDVVTKLFTRLSHHTNTSLIFIS